MKYTVFSTVEGKKKKKCYVFTELPFHFLMKNVIQTILMKNH